MQWTGTAEALWNAAEAAETRRNACTSRELRHALPAELPLDDQARLVRGFACWLRDEHGVAVHWVIHAPRFEDRAQEKALWRARGEPDGMAAYLAAASDPDMTNLNYHAHIRFTVRRVDAATGAFGEKTRDLDRKNPLEPSPEEGRAGAQAHRRRDAEGDPRRVGEADEPGAEARGIARADRPAFLCRHGGRGRRARRPRGAAAPRPAHFGQGARRGGGRDAQDPEGGHRARGGPCAQRGAPCLLAEAARPRAQAGPARRRGRGRGPGPGGTSQASGGHGTTPHRRRGYRGRARPRHRRRDVGRCAVPRSARARRRCRTRRCVGHGRAVRVRVRGRCARGRNSGRLPDTRYPASARRRDRRRRSVPPATRPPAGTARTAHGTTRHRRAPGTPMPP